MASSRNQEKQINACERRKQNRKEMEALQGKEYHIRADQQCQLNSERIVPFLTIQDENEASKQDQLKFDRMVSVRDAE